MLSRNCRLTKNKDIERVAARGRSFFTKIVGIKYFPNNLSISRYAVVAGLKVSKKSTTRNRTKRRLREILRKHLKRLGAGYDVIIVARPEASLKNYKEIEDSLIYALEKTLIFK